MKGILFRLPGMVTAAVEGGKTQFRQPVRPQPKRGESMGCYYGEGYPTEWVLTDWYGDTIDAKCPQPRYQIGETVYIKEAWASYPAYEPHKPYVIYKTSVDAYRLGQTKWQNPLFMPEWAARHFIKILAVRAERLQEITHSPFDADCHAEGFDKPSDLCLNDFMRYWDSTNPKYPWESNPWVFPYEFELVKEG